MFLARVKGHVVSTAKDPGLSGARFMVIEPLKVDYDKPQQAGAEGKGSGGSTAFGPTGRAIVAIDSIGVGEGQLVLVTQGSSARQAEGCGKLPVDAVIVGIVDSVMLGGNQVE